MGIKKALTGAARYLYKFITLKLLFPHIYKKNSRAPVMRNRVIFIEVRMPELSDNFRLIFDRLQRCGEYDIKLYCLGLGSVGVGEYRRRCIEMIKDAATASVVFINEGSNVLGCLPMRRETKVIQTWHACGAFKKFGYGTAELSFGGSRRELDTFPVYRNNTFVTVSSPEITWAYAESMGLNKDCIVPVGVSRTDVFFDPGNSRRARAKLTELIPKAQSSKILLYAPTFRGGQADAAAPDRLDIPLLRQALEQSGEDWILLIKHHPLVKMRPQIPDSCRDFAFDLSDKMPIDALMTASDVCVTDYSSLVFEYSLLSRPMLFFAYDIDSYIDERGFYYPFDQLIPGPVVSTTEELAAALSSPELYDMTRIDEFRRRFMSSCDGHATDRILGLAFDRDDL